MSVWLCRGCLCCLLGGVVATTLILLSLGNTLRLHQQTPAQGGQGLAQGLVSRIANYKVFPFSSDSAPFSSWSSSLVCPGLTAEGFPCVCDRSCLGGSGFPPFPSSVQRLTGSSSFPSQPPVSPRCALPQSQTCYDQSEVQEYEYIQYYTNHQQQTIASKPGQTLQTASKSTSRTEPAPPVPLYSSVDPPTFHRDGNCAITFRNVIMTGGHRIILYSNDTKHTITQLSAHSNVGLLYGRLSVSNVGSPLLHRYSMTYVTETQQTYRQQMPTCTRHYKDPVFVFGSRDHTLGNYYHFLAELFNLAFWTVANPNNNALRPIPNSQVSGVSGSSVAWSSSNATIIHYCGAHSYEQFSIKLSDLTPGKGVEPIFTTRERNPNTQGVECFDQVTIASENNLNIFLGTFIRRQVQPFLDWMDWRYNISEQYTARKHGWKVLVSSLAPSPSNPDARPHAVLSVRKPGGRFLHNVSLVVSMFESHGFRVTKVDFGRLSAKKTIEIIRTAHVLCAVHGAGLSNSMFLHAGATMMQLINPVHPIHFSIYPRVTWNVGAEYLEMKIIELKDTTVMIKDWQALEALIVSAKANARRLLEPGATWSPTRPNVFTWHVAPMVAQCQVPITEYPIQ